MRFDELLVFIHFLAATLAVTAYVLTISIDAGARYSNERVIKFSIVAFCLEVVA